MSWGGGADVAIDMIKSLNVWVPDQMLRYRIYLDLIESLTSLDWDCYDEAMGEDEMFDKAVEFLYPRES